MFPKVSIIILNWNGKEDTIECLESLKHIRYPNYEILLVDNGSTDGSVECFKEKYPKIEIIENKKNLGFAEGNNVGIRKVMERSTNYILLLNNDTVVDPEFLGELVKVADSDPKIGIVGAKIYYYEYNGKKDILNFAGGQINFFKGETYHIGLNNTDKGQYDYLRTVQYIEGSCMLIKKDVIRDIGVLDPDYFAYWEETDYCVRTLNKGYSIYYVPNAKIWHKIGASTKKDNNMLYLYLMTRNRILFMRKNAPLIFKITFIPFLLKDLSASLLSVFIVKKNMKEVYNSLIVMFKAICFPNNLELHIKSINESKSYEKY